MPQKIVDRAIERDPDAAAAEYLSEFRTDIESFVDREVVESLVVAERRELRHVPGKSYIAFTDPHGGGSDSFTLAIAHDENGNVVLDALRERTNKTPLKEIVREYAETIRSYGLVEVTGDKYAKDWPKTEFIENSVNFNFSERSKSELYGQMLPILNCGNCELLDNKKLVEQICSLERRTARGTGKDSIDHPPNLHDFLANAAAGAIVLASGNRGELESLRKIGERGDEIMMRIHSWYGRV